MMSWLIAFAMTSGEQVALRSPMATRGRSADPNQILGHGYAFLIAAKYGAKLLITGVEHSHR